MKIGVIGAGRLGICFALLLERAGYHVMASDIRTNYVSALSDRKITTNEPQVADMLAMSRNFHATTNTRELISQCDLIYVMVATPSLDDGSYDVSAVWRVVHDISECDFDLSKKILVIGCTTNPGDCGKIQHFLESKNIPVLYNPEFITQGSIISDLQNADIVLIGGQDKDVVDRYCEVWRKIQHSEPNIHMMSHTAAELVKIAINCYLTTKISFANMLGEVLIKSGLEKDIGSALGAIGADSRIGKKYLKYGFGFGGPCLPRDNRSFGHYVKKLGLEFNLGSTVDAFNNEHALFLKNYYIAVNSQKLPYYMKSISYKPNTDIVEESQQLRLCKDLLSAGHTVYVEPSRLIPAELQHQLQDTFKNLHFVSCSDLEQKNITFIDVIV